MKVLKLIIKCLRKTSIFIYFLLSIILNYLVTYIPIIIQGFLDVLLNQKVNITLINYVVNNVNSKNDFILFICGILLLIQFFVVLITYVRNILKNKIVQDFQFKLKLELFNHIQNLTYQDFYQKSLAELVQNSSDDVNNLVNFFDKQLTYILDIALIIIFAAMQLSKINLSLSAVMVVAVLIIIILSIWYFISSREIIENKIISQRNLYDKLNDNYSNIKFIKINNLQNKEKDSFRKITQENLNANVKKIAIDSWYNMLVANIVRLQVPFILIISSFLYLQDLITIGAIYVTINYSNKVTSSFVNMAELMEFYNLCRISYKRLNNLLNLTLEDYKMSQNFNIDDTTITFKDVKIIVNNEVILKDLNFQINPSEKVLICGATGSGKSILLKTLVGFYDYEGSIKIGNYEIRDLKKKNIRDNVCLLLQDSYLFSKTIAENIRILVPYMPSNEMIDLSKFFSLHDDIMKLDSGYESEIGKRGISLSKGQRQRLILARAYAKPKNIMIFDDSFSAIDRINKKKIINNLFSLHDESTKIFISHNISEASKFDKIIYLEKNTAVCKNHLELINSNINYKNNYNLCLNKVGDDYA